MKRRGIVILSVFLLGVLGFVCGSHAASQAFVQADQTGAAAQKPKAQEAPAPKPAPKKGVSEAAQAEAKLEPKMPAGAPGKPFHFPKPATKALANGLSVFVVSGSKEPSVTVRLVLTAAGSLYDPAGKPGVAAMTANLLTQGTGKRSAQQIAEAIDFVGGSLSASADHDGAYITVTVVKKDFDLAMDLLSDVTLHAEFKSEELERRRQQLLSGLQLQYSDPSYLASVTFDRVVYGQHLYGLPDEGTPESVRALSRDDVVHFRDAYYVPNQALLAFAGDITPEAAFAAAEKYLGAWPRKDAVAADALGTKRPKGVHIFLIDKPDAVQTQIRVGRPGIRRNHPDYIPLYVTNRIFGGGFNSRLNTEVRQKKGLTYGASSGFNSHKLAGDFEASTSTRTEATVEATKLVVDLIGRMASGEVAPEELTFATDYLAGVFPIQSETPEQVAGRILAVAHFDLPADYNDTYQQKVREVGPEQVKAMATRYFDVADLDLVLVGNAGQFREALKKEFPNAKSEEIAYDQLDLLAADLRKAKETPAAATPESIERGKAILAAAAQAAGGAALDSIESVEFTTSGKISVPQGEFSTQAKAWVVFPDHLSVETTLPFGVIKQGFDGKAGWSAGPQGASDLPPNFNAEFQRSIDLVAGWGVYRQAMAGKAQVSFLGEEEIDGKKTLAVEWLSGPAKAKLYFDPETHLLVGARYRQVTPQGPAEILQVWSDFQDVSGAAAGVKFPRRSVNYRQGAKFTETTVEGLKVNTKPDLALFSKPAK